MVNPKRSDEADDALSARKEQIVKEMHRNPALAKSMIADLTADYPDDPAVAARVLLFKAAIKSNEGDFDKQLEFSREALKLCRAHSLRLLEADALRVVGSYYVDHQNPTLAFEHLTAALELSVDLGHTMQIAQTHSSLGILHAVIYDFDESFKHFQQALDKYREVGGGIGMAKTHSNLATLYMEIDQDSNAIKHLKESLKYCEQESNHYSAAIALSSLGVMHKKREEHKQAIEYYERALEVGAGLPDTFKNGYTYARLALSHAILNNRKEAEGYLNQALQLVDKAGEHMGVDVMWTLCAETLVNLNRKQEARDLYLRAFQLHKPGSNQGVLEDIHEALAGLYAEEENMEGALRHQQMLSELRQKQRNHLVKRAVEQADRRRDILYSEQKKYSDKGIRSVKQKNHLLGRLVQSQSRSNRMMQSIHAELEKELPQTSGQARRIAQDTIGLIKRIMSENQDLPQIDSFLAEEHEEFVSRLSKRCPALTPTEMRVCILISLKLRSKEIADSMFISLDTVKTHRKNVRSKLKLPTGTNLTTFFVDLAATPS